METLQKFLVDDAQAIVITVHGSGEHIGRHKHVAEWLNKNQISMIGGDLPGLGRSKEIRGHIENFNDYLAKVDEWLRYTKGKWPNKPIFLFGHSMGGLIVLRYLEELKDKKFLNGAVVTSPSIKIGIEIPKWQLTVAKTLEKIWPTFRLSSGIKAHQVSRDPEVVERYEKDPLVYSKVSIRWFFEFQRAIADVWDKIDKLKGIKLLFMQAGKDLLVDPLAASDYVAKADNGDIEFHFISDLYHEILNEPEKETYLKLMSDWILDKV